jgi:cobaltochelatase CobS
MSIQSVNPSSDSLSDMHTDSPDITCRVREVFSIESNLVVPAFALPSEHVPESDSAYRFDPETTLAILAGFAHNRRVMVQGYHGTGKTSHIEQVAERINCPACGSTWTAMSAVWIW